MAGSIQEEENPAFAFTLMEENEEGVCNLSTARHVPTMNVGIDDIVQEVLIASGSVSNLMGEDDFQYFKNAGFKGEPQTFFWSCVLKASVNRVLVDTIGRYGDRHSADISTDTRPICWPSVGQVSVECRSTCCFS